MKKLLTWITLPIVLFFCNNAFAMSHTAPAIFPQESSIEIKREQENYGAWGFVAIKGVRYGELLQTVLSYSDTEGIEASDLKISKDDLLSLNREKILGAINAYAWNISTGAEVKIVNATIHTDVATGVYQVKLKTENGTTAIRNILFHNQVEEESLKANPRFGDHNAGGRKKMIEPKTVMSLWLIPILLLGVFVVYMLRKLTIINELLYKDET